MRERETHEVWDKGRHWIDETTYDRESGEVISHRYVIDGVTVSRATFDEEWIRCREA